MRRRAGSPRLAVTAIFFINGAALSSLYARLPALQADLRLADAALGALLLATALGLLLAQPAAAAVAARRGSAPVTRASALALAAVLPLPALAPTAIPWPFMATSSAPLHAPNATARAGSTHRFTRRCRSAPWPAPPRPALSRRSAPRPPSTSRLWARSSPPRRTRPGAGCCRPTWTPSRTAPR